MLLKRDDDVDHQGPSWADLRESMRRFAQITTYLWESILTLKTTFLANCPSKRDCESHFRLCPYDLFVVELRNIILVLGRSSSRKVA